MMKSTFLNYVFYVMSGLIVLTFMGCPANPCPPLPVVQNVPLIPAMDVANMVYSYKMERINVINGTTGVTHEPNFIDSRFITFNADSIVNFISYINKKIIENHLDIRLQGIRCIYTVYPKKPKNGFESSYMSQISPDKRGYHALIIAPTYLDSLNIEQVFDVNYFDSSSRKPKPINFSDSSIFNRNLSFLNMGGLCPPGCQTAPVMFNTIDSLGASGRLNQQ